MNFQFHVKKEDYQKSLIGYFKYWFFPSFLISILFTVIISSAIADSNYEKSEFSWPLFFLSFPICLIITLYWFWGRKFLKSIKALKKKELNDIILNINILEKGINFNKVGSDEITEKYWSQFKKISNSKNFTYFLFTDETYIFLNNNSRNTAEIETFKNIIKEKIKPFESKMSTNLVWMSFIPIVGLIFGLVFFLRGISERNLRYFLISISSFIFTIIVWIGFAMYMDASGKSNQTNVFVTKNNLNILTKELAYYKLKNGKFPETLEELKSQNKFLIFHETNTSFNPFSESKIQYFYYQNQDSTYILRSLGLDGKIFTDDDLIPDY